MCGLRLFGLRLFGACVPVVVALVVMSMGASGMYVENWKAVDASNNAPSMSGYDLSLALDDSERLFLAFRNTLQAEKPFVCVCDLGGGGGGCVAHDVSAGEGLRSGLGSSLAVDSARGLVYVATQNGFRDDELYLHVCTAGGSGVGLTGCVARDASAGVGSFSGQTPSIAVDEASGRVYVVARATGGRPYLFICNLGGLDCTARDASGAAGDFSGFNPSLALSPNEDRVYIAARAGEVAASTPALFHCHMNGSNCVFRDISVDQGANTGFDPSLSVDAANGLIVVATRALPNLPILFVCSLGGTSCTKQVVDPLGLGSSFSDFAPSLVLDPGAGKAWVATSSDASGTNVPFVTSCDYLSGTITGCVAQNASAAGEEIGTGPLALLLDSVKSHIYLGISNAGRGRRPFLFSPSLFAPDPSSVTTTTPMTLGPTSPPDFVLNLVSVPGAPSLVFPRDTPRSVFDYAVLVSVNGMPPAPAASFVVDGGARVGVNVLDAFADYVLSFWVAGEELSAFSPVSVEAALDVSLGSMPAFAGGPSSSLALESGAEHSVILSLHPRSGTTDLPLPLTLGQSPSSFPALSAVLSKGVGSSVNITLTQVSPDSLDVTISFLVEEPGLYSLDVLVNSNPLPGNYIIDFGFACPPGQQAIGEVCSDCPLASYQPRWTVGGESCLPCAPGLLTETSGSTSFLNCTCERGLWYGRGPRTNSSVCVACPPGGFCLGGAQYPVADAGFFPRSEEDPYSFVACTREGCLRGGACAQGYRQSFACGECMEGYYSASETECARCPSSSTPRLVVIFILLVLGALVLAVLVAWSTLHTAQVLAVHSGDETDAVDQKALSAFRARTIPVSLSIILQAVQVVGILVQSSLSWKDESRSVLLVFSYFNIDSQTVAAECSLASFHLTYVLSILTFVFLLLVVVVGVLALKLFGGVLPFLRGLSDLSYRVLLDSVLFSLVPPLYIPICRATLVLFDCSRLPNSEIVLDVDNGVRCFDADWWEVFPLGLVVVLVFLVGSPVYFGLTIWSRRETLFHRSVMTRFGSLYRNFRRDYVWGEIANLGKRLFVVWVSLFLSKSPLLQISLLTVILVGSLVFVSSHRPYFVPLYNDIDIRLTVVLICILMLGAASYAERTNDSSDSLLFAATILAVLALGLVSIHALIMDVLSIRRDAPPTRHKRLVDVVSSELRDIRVNDRLSLAASEFLELLDTTVHQKPLELTALSSEPTTQP